VITAHGAPHWPPYCIEDRTMASNAKSTKPLAITTANHPTIVAAVQAALAAALTPLGLAAKIDGRTTYDRGGEFATMKIQIVRAEGVDGSDTPTGKDAADFKAYAAMEGYDASWLGEWMPHPTLGDVQIRGFRARARSKPIIVKAKRDSREYILTVDALKTLAVRGGKTLPAHWSNEKDPLLAHAEKHLG
jgi:hypothetical protein